MRCIRPVRRFPSRRCTNLGVEERAAYEGEVPWLEITRLGMDHGSHGDAGSVPTLFRQAAKDPRNR